MLWLRLARAAPYRGFLIRHAGEPLPHPRTGHRIAQYNSAIQQIANLRYGYTDQPTAENCRAVKVLPNPEP